MRSLSRAVLLEVSKNLDGITAIPRAGHNTQALVLPQASGTEVMFNAQRAEYFSAVDNNCAHDTTTIRESHHLALILAPCSYA